MPIALRKTAPDASPVARQERRVRVRRLGRLPSGEGVALGESLVARRQAAAGGDTLLLLEHPPVVTLGRGADPSHLLLPPEELRRRGIEVCETNRGGDVTFHAPGQLVGYPILKLPAELRDLHLLLRMVEEVLI